MVTKRSDTRETMQKKFFMAKALLMATPIFSYIYITMKASMNGIYMQELLSQDPATTIILVNSMLNAYGAYLLHLAENNFEKAKTKSAVINIGLLTISQALSRNVFCFIVLLFVAVRAIRFYGIFVKDTLRSITVKQFFYDGGGSLIIVLLNTLMLYATIKLM